MANWECPKCKNGEFEKDQFQATGGNFAKVFDVQNKFITISCTKCGYTELYKKDTSREWIYLLFNELIKPIEDYQ